MAEHALRVIQEWGVLAYGGTQVLALLTIPSVLLKHKGDPRGMLSWVLSLFALPIAGVLMWWLFGRVKLQDKRRRRIARSRSHRSKEFIPQDSSSDEEKVASEFGEVLPRRALNESVFPSRGNQVDVLCDGAEIFPAIEQAIESATESINLLFYIWQEDETGQRMLDLLIRKAREGVAIRVLVDSWGSPKFMKKHSASLQREGIKAESFFPAPFRSLTHPVINFVNHRKIVVVDDRIGITGGANVGDEYVNEWHDVMIRVQGPAVGALQHVFLDDWYFASGELVPGHALIQTQGATDFAAVISGPDSEEWIHDAFFYEINQAMERIWLLTPYFIPSAALVMALRGAANRGVDVRVMVPANSDVQIVKLASRSYYDDLLTAHIKVYEYQGPVVHAKTMLIDQEAASVGSANFDTRSLRFSFELSCFFRDASSNRRLEEYYLMLLEDAQQITRQELAERGVITRLIQGVAHLASPLL